jgi:acetoin utilization deacetylase AcuC-like enzyme
MTTALFTHPACHGHMTPRGHPERVDRLHAVLDALAGGQFEHALWRDAPEASDATLELVHPKSYIEEVERIAREAGPKPVPLDPDTWACQGSIKAARHGVGAAVGAVDAVMSGQANNAFCAVRPPGHHAEPQRAMGFCLYNNIAIAAAHAQNSYGLGKVAIVDFDVHHGNGTQAVFEQKPSVFFASSHQMPHYPGSGEESERGVGNILNIPLPAGTGSASFRNAWESRVFPRLRDFEPEFLFISAGFDGHADDPLADFELGDADFAWITSCLLSLADELCDGRVVSTLEGGYDLNALQQSVVAHVEELLKAG